MYYSICYFVIIQLQIQPYHGSLSNCLFLLVLKSSCFHIAYVLSKPEKVWDVKDQKMLTVCWRSHKRHVTTAWSSRQWLRRSRFTLWKADISCRSYVWTCLYLMTLTPVPTTGSYISCLGPTLAARASTSSRYCPNEQAPVADYLWDIPVRLQSTEWSSTGCPWLAHSYINSSEL